MDEKTTADDRSGVTQVPESEINHSVFRQSGPPHIRNLHFPGQTSDKAAETSSLSPASIQCEDAWTKESAADEPSGPSADSSTGQKEPIISPPPDGGWLAWSQVIAGHLLTFNAWGFANSFGVFQVYLTTYLSRDASDISWIGSMQIFLTYFIGTLSGRALDAGYFRVLVLAGVALQIVGIMASSFITEYWQLFLAQGICQGLGNGMIITPTMAVISTYFSAKRRSRAVMGMSSGTATGGAIFPLVARQLLDRIGYRWTLRVMGFIVVFNGAIALCLIRARLPPRKRGAIVELSSFLDPWYGCATFGIFFCCLSLYVGYFYMTVFAEQVLHASQSVSFEILLLSNVMGLPGRLIQAYLADRFIGPVNGILLSSSVTAVTSFSWIAINSVGGVFAFAAVYGYFGAAITTFFPAALAQTRRDPTRVGVEIGMCFSLASIGCLIGPPIAGAIIAADNGTFLGAQLFTGIFMLVGTGLVLIAKYIGSRPTPDGT